MQLDKQQKLQLKKQAHHLKPVILIGQHGLTDAVLNEIGIALDTHELIKVKVAGADKIMLQAVADQICEKTQATLVQLVGRIITIYRENQS